MKIHFFKPLLFLPIVWLSFSACKREDHFELKGIMKSSDTDVSYIGMSSGFIVGDFSNFDLEKDENSINDGVFEIEGRINYPHAFRFITNTGEISGLFFLDPKKEQSVVIDTLGIHRNIIIGNSKTNEEYLKTYLPLLENLNIEHMRLKDSWADSIPEKEKEHIQRSTQEILKRKDEVLLNYIKSNPDSYVGMWVLAENFSIYGYKRIYEVAYKSLSESIKSTHSGRHLKEKLSVSGISGLNGNLPSASLYEYEVGKNIVSFTDLPSKYTLVDFWASYCAPCIRAFPKIKIIYDSTDRKYFDVLAISVDSEKSVDAWREFIERKNYPWRQLLDDEMKFSKKLMINAVPANFLVDAKGTILMKNVSPEELEEFFEQEAGRIE